MPTDIEISANYMDPMEAVGQSVIPRAKIMKIIKTDEDAYQCNKPATHLISVATEMFIQFLTEQGVRSLVAQRKQRKTVQYKDYADAVSRIDSLEFLSDVIPQVTVTKQFRVTKSTKLKPKQTTSEIGQLTLNDLLKLQTGPDAVMLHPELRADHNAELDEG